MVRPVEIVPQFKFDARNPEAVQRAQSEAAIYVREVSDKTKNSIRDRIVEGIRQGVSVPEVGKRIRPLVGLTTRQMLSADRFFNKLDPNLPLSKREALFKRFVERKKNDRAFRIARNEVNNSLNAGLNQAWQQAIKEGHLSKNAKKVVITTLDDNRCPICIPLEGQVKPIDKPFDTITGDQMRPPFHLGGCRCTMGLTEGKVTKTPGSVAAAEARAAFDRQPGRKFSTAAREGLVLNDLQRELRELEGFQGEFVADRAGKIKRLKAQIREQRKRLKAARAADAALAGAAPVAAPKPEFELTPPGDIDVSTPEGVAAAMAQGTHVGGSTDGERLSSSMNEKSKQTVEFNGIEYSGIFKPVLDEDGLSRYRVDHDIHRLIDRMGTSSTGTFAEREALTWEIDNLFGLEMVPPTIVRELDGRVGSFQLLVPGNDYYKGDSSVVSREDYLNMTFIDLLTGNIDRHPGNGYVDFLGDGNMMAIDNGSGFPVPFTATDGNGKPFHSNRDELLYGDFWSNNEVLTSEEQQQWLDMLNDPRLSELIANSDLGEDEKIATMNRFKVAKGLIETNQVGNMFRMHNIDGSVVDGWLAEPGFEAVIGGEPSLTDGSTQLSLDFPPLPTMADVDRAATIVRELGPDNPLFVEMGDFVAGGGSADDFAAQNRARVDQAIAAQRAADEAAIQQAKQAKLDEIVAANKDIVADEERILFLVDQPGPLRDEFLPLRGDEAKAFIEEHREEIDQLEEDVKAELFTSEPFNLTNLEDINKARAEAGLPPLAETPPGITSEAAANENLLENPTGAGDPEFNDPLHEQDPERRLFVENDEDLHNAWLASGLNIEAFVVQNRVAIDNVRGV